MSHAEVQAFAEWQKKRCYRDLDTRTAHIWGEARKKDHVIANLCRTRVRTASLGQFEAPPLAKDTTTPVAFRELLITNSKDLHQLSEQPTAQAYHLRLRVDEKLYKQPAEWEEFLMLFQHLCSPTQRLHQVRSIAIEDWPSVELLLICVSLLPCIRRLDLSTAYPTTKELFLVALRARGLEEFHCSLLPCPEVLQQDLTLITVSENKAVDQSSTTHQTLQRNTHVPHLCELLREFLNRSQDAVHQPQPDTRPRWLGSNTHRVRLMEFHHCFQWTAGLHLWLFGCPSLEHIALRQVPADMMKRMLTQNVKGNQHQWQQARVKHPLRAHTVDIWQGTQTVLLSRKQQFMVGERIGVLPYCYQNLVVHKGVYESPERNPAVKGIWRYPQLQVDEWSKWESIEYL